MGLNKEVENEIKKEGFIKKNVKKSGEYLKSEGSKFTNFKDIVFYSSFIKKIVLALNPFKKREKGKEESFENAVKRMNIDEEQMKTAFSYFRFYFIVGLFLFGASLLFGLYLLIFKGNYWAIGPTIACMAIGAAQMVNGSFRTYQINNRILCSMAHWKDNGFYFPTKFKSDSEITTIKRQKAKEELKRLSK